MKRVAGGTFWMGAQSANPNGQNYDSEADGDEGPAHSVTLSTFYMGETEVTQELWQAVMGSNPSYFSGTNRPVERVSWNMIVNQFIPALNALTGRTFRLPTEAEWEYAARGGNQGHGYKYAG
ncbi:MAG: formylglycine-generating enzyme family protein, partial [Bacteroidales bacterium]|nr:formylglycine-generating enzyme family protein [Bacteroidales bacterium]